MNILLIEPSDICRRELETILTPYAMNLYITESGEKGIDIYQSSSIDLVCLSFQLSDMEGLEFVI
ncbi:MAG: DNA-binding response regulator, partial [Bacteroidetes bacterium]|nr:DNA-binding response regulator [Bacteroidota bacterium]